MYRFNNSPSLRKHLDVTLPFGLHVSPSRLTTISKQPSNNAMLRCITALSRLINDSLLCVHAKNGVVKQLRSSNAVHDINNKLY